MLAVIVFLIISISAAPSFAGDKVITLRYSDQQPITSPSGQIVAAWCKEVEKRTNGKVKVHHYPGATMNSPLKMYESVVQGVVDICGHFLGYTQGRFPLTEIVYDCPFPYPSCTAAAEIAQAYYDKFKPKEFDDVKVLYFYSAPPPILLATKPVHTLADLNGLKIRTMGSNAKIMKEFGAVPIGLPMPEVYDALSKGIIEGITNPYSPMKEYKLADIIKYTFEYKGPSFLGLGVVAMNKKKWNSLPPDVQKAIEEVSKEWLVKQGKVWDDLEKEAKEYSLSKGVKVTKISPEDQEKWASAASMIFKEKIAAVKEKGLPGEEVVQFVNDELKQYH